MTNVYDKEYERTLKKKYQKKIWTLYERLGNLCLWSVNSMVKYVMGGC